MGFVQEHRTSRPERPHIWCNALLYLDVLNNVWPRGPSFSMCTGSHKLGSQSYLHVLYLWFHVVRIRRRQWHPTPVLLPGKSHGRRSLQSMQSQRVGNDWATSLFTFMYCRRKWQPAPVFLPGESQGQRILVGCRLWGRTEADTTEVT